jgi:molybdenum cofactor biosynthesis protein MoaC
MIDVSPKFSSLRYARAEGCLYGKPEVLSRVADKTVPKGDVLEVARAAGITAAKRCSDMIVFCHPIPLDWVEINFEIESDHIRVIAQVRSVWKTGVEVEAITAVTGALLNAYDMLKPLDADLSFGNIRVLKKRGGKNDFNDRFNKKLPAAVLVISDSTFAGKRKDKSGKIIRAFLEKQPVNIKVYEVLPDDEERITTRLRQLVDEEGVRLIFTTGGTGLGPRDLTPEATRKMIDREVPGIAEAIRRHGKERTPYAMLSRELVGVRGENLIINLPGSSMGAKESLEAIFPGVLHAFPMMSGVGHGNVNNNSGLNKEGARHD